MKKGEASDETTISSGAFQGCEKLEKDNITNFDKLNVQIDAFDFE